MERKHGKFSMMNLKPGFFFMIFGFALGIVAAMILGQNGNSLPQLVQNFAMELVVAFIALLFLIRWYQGYEGQKILKASQQRLLEDMVNPSPDIMTPALQELRKNNWHKGSDSLLQGAHLEQVNFEGIEMDWGNLRRASLQQAKLKGANLCGTNLSETNLTEADLREANLRYANLGGANLRNADLTDAYVARANLARASLKGANLSGANLTMTDLSGTDLSDAKLDGAIISAADGYVQHASSFFSEQTILPDNTRWTPQTDLARFGVVVVRN